jgi:predicted nucleic-acid-binding protein
VVALDTNVVVRLLVGDDPAQTRIAERTFLEHPRGDGVFLPIVVLVEIACVLAQGHQLDRATVHERIDRGPSSSRAETRAIASGALPGPEAVR